MKILRYPAVNGVFIGLFSAFYSLILIVTSGHKEFESILYYTRVISTGRKGSDWGAFLYAGNQKFIGLFIIAITLLIIILLIIKRKTYDEYQTQLLCQCFLVAGFITICAVALLFLAILGEPAGIVEKITLFVIIHWISVLFADLVFVLFCRSK